ncbi:MAG: hypothetical protein Q8R28_14170 [Dehalococcoidia bacterium]|nr:hypothetical protein [Dehalococcoidia bacterium]
MLRTLRLAWALRRHPDIAALLEDVDRDPALLASVYELLQALQEAAEGARTFRETQTVNTAAQAVVRTLRGGADVA